MNRYRPTHLLMLLLMALVPAAMAQYRLPEGSYTVQPGALQLHSPHFTDTYIFGFGWASGLDLPDPIVIGQNVSVGALVLALLNGEAEAGEVPAATPSLFEPARPDPPAAALEPLPSWQRPADPGITEPLLARIANVRFGGSGEVRVVFDIPELQSTARLLPLTAQGNRANGEELRLDLPGLLPPVASRWSERGVTVEFSGDSVSIAPAGSAYSFSVFPVDDPVRLVIDLIPGAPAGFSVPPPPVSLAEPIPIGQETVRPLAAGVSYLQFRYPNGQGNSGVHVIRVAPGAGRFSVVGSNRNAATLSDLARGSIVAINAGYFNTTTFDHIGLLRTGNSLESLPTLGRASIGMNGQQLYIARTSAEVQVRLDGFRQVSAPAGPSGIEVLDTPGQRAGDASRGVLLLQNNLVTANRVGPLTVPHGGLALAYNPEIRDLALLEPGDRVTYELSFDPPFFNGANAAVEAGPLLVDGGRPAFQPELENFQRGQRILDDYTSQSAIGIMPDGTVLLVVADTMRAQDLVPLFLSLGAGQAMRLDSGGSAALYAGGSVLNRNIERRIVSAIVLLPH